MVMQDLEQGVVSESAIAILEQLKTNLFTGSLTIKAREGLNWTLYFRLGRLIWLSGGANPDERWERLMGLFCPNITLKSLDLTQRKEVYGEYKILAQLKEQELIKREQLDELVTSAVTEVIFDAIQYGETSTTPLSFETKKNDTPGLILVLVQTEQAIMRANEEWNQWLNAGLSAISPNSYPIIQNPSVIGITPSIYRLIDGTQTLRGLAAKSRQNLLNLTQSLMPLVESGALFFAKVPISRKLDQKGAIDSNINDLFVSPPGESPLGTSKPLVACVDDSPLVCQALEKIITYQGYRFIGIQDSMKVIPILLKSKPDLIFLDLLMPMMNGYEVCAHIRKTQSLKDVPIVILTGKDGLVDRMRAKLVGSTEFMNKPVNVTEVSNMLHKYLPVAEGGKG